MGAAVRHGHCRAAIPRGEQSPGADCLTPAASHGTAGGQGPGNRYLFAREVRFERRISWTPRGGLSPQGPVGIKPSSVMNTGDGSSRAARLDEDRSIRKRRREQEPQESHCGRMRSARRSGMQTREPSLRLRGTTHRSSCSAASRNGEEHPSLFLSIEGERRSFGEGATTVAMIPESRADGTRSERRHVFEEVPGSS